MPRPGDHSNTSFVFAGPTRRTRVSGGRFLEMFFVVASTKKIKNTYLIFNVFLHLHPPKTKNMIVIGCYNMIFRYF